VQARTLEVLQTIGLAEPFLDRGTIAAGAQIYVDGRAAGGFSFENVGHPDTPYPLVLVLPQSDVEAILIEHLGARGIDVERGVTATGLDQDAAGVTLRVTDGQGAEHALRSRHLIGADGAHSIVRKALGLTFAGAAYAQTFLLADCSLEGDLAEGPLSIFFHREHFALWFPMKGERRGRVVTTSRQAVTDPSIAGQGSSPATLAEVEASFREAASRDLRLTDAVWLSRYRVHHRGVDRYGVGRVFVAGDAAHIHSPAGGQGMNTGLQDVFNLVWKLVASLRCEAPAALLASYDAERRPVGETVLAATDRAFSVVTSSSGWVAAARNVLLPVLGATIGRSGRLRSRAFHFLSELGIRYEPGAAVQDEAGSAPSWAGGPAPGRRAPDARISRTKSVFDLLAGYRFHLVAFSRNPLSGAAIERLADELEAVAAASGHAMGAHLVAHSLVGRHPRAIQVENDTLLSTYGVTAAVPEALYLVRPDGHVAWRGPSLDLTGCRAFMAERFGGRAGP
jgi:2-polyprenyl-6-methoxyphenol hydroxylase-like FAD-dependent oxidoreductase